MHVESPISPGLFRIIRVARIARLLRSIEYLRGIRQLIFTAIKSAPALANVCLILFLIVFIYAVLGMTIFQHVRLNGNGLNEVVNFRTFWSSVGLLFRISTAAGWNIILNSTMLEPPNCDPNFKFYPNDVGNGITEGNIQIQTLYLQ